MANREPGRARNPPPPRGAKVARARTVKESYRARMTCFHEAGHVVVAHAFGWPLAGVKLGVRGGGLEVKSAGLFGTPGGRSRGPRTGGGWRC